MRGILHTREERVADRTFLFWKIDKIAHRNIFTLLITPERIKSHHKYRGQIE